ncbi:SCO family protein, partial [Aromatoleum toluclasticum]|nr:SCO family protein [Aromatoleum toluclasticum]
MIAARCPVPRRPRRLASLAALAQALTRAVAPGAFAHGKQHDDHAAPAAATAQAVTPPATGGGTH